MVTLGNLLDILQHNPAKVIYFMMGYTEHREKIKRIKINNIC